jgi:hypothetical protein
MVDRLAGKTPPAEFTEPGGTSPSNLSTMYRSVGVKRVNEDQVTGPKREGRYGGEGRIDDQRRQKPNETLEGAEGTISGNPPSRRRHQARRTRPNNAPDRLVLAGSRRQHAVVHF